VVLALTYQRWRRSRTLLITSGPSGPATDAVIGLLRSSASFGQRVIVDNRPAAGNTIAPAYGKKRLLTDTLYRDASSRTNGRFTSAAGTLTNRTRAEMTQNIVDVETAAREGRRAIREASPWLVRFGRFGYVTKGVVYVLIGVLALQTTIGAGGETTDSRGALRHIGLAPFGELLLIAAGIGILGYSLWLFTQAIMDTENFGKAPKGIAMRLGYSAIAVLHVGLAISAFALASGADGGADQNAQAWTARLMSRPFGKWLIGIAGLIVAGFGVSQLYLAYSAKFRECLKLNEMSATEVTWTTRLGRIGHAARGIVFVIVGAFLVFAALYADAQQARGLDGALEALAQQPWGSVVLGIVALGLAAFGIFMFVEARYRRMVIT
jgi:Domain of Unknown Function (DUF1206)